MLQEVKFRFIPIALLIIILPYISIANTLENLEPSINHDSDLGTKILIDLNLEDAHSTYINGLWPDVRDLLRDERNLIGPIRRLSSPPDQMRVRIQEPRNDVSRPEVANLLLRQKEKAISSKSLGSFESNSFGFVVNMINDEIVLSLSEKQKELIDEKSIQQSIQVFRQRMKNAGHSNAIIYQYSQRQVVIENLKGFGSDDIRRLINSKGQLDFYPIVRLTDSPNSPPGPGNKIFKAKNTPNSYYIIEKGSIITNKDITNALVVLDKEYQPEINLLFDSSGARSLKNFAAANIGSKFAIVLDEEVIMAPELTVDFSSEIGVISGNFTIEEIRDLVIVLQSGALPVQPTIANVFSNEQK